MKLWATGQEEGTLLHMCLCLVTVIGERERSNLVVQLAEGSNTAGNLDAIARNQSEITEIWLEIRNQGLENPVEIRKSARSHEKSGNQEKSQEKSARNHEISGKKSSEIREILTRDHVPSTHTNAYHYSFFCDAPRTWNLLPHSVTSLPSLNQFKRSVSNFM